jgi:hypothetical protein
MVGEFGGTVLINNLLQKDLKVFPHNLGVGMIFAQQISEEFNGFCIQGFSRIVASLGVVEICQIVEAGGDSGMAFTKCFGAIAQDVFSQLQCWMNR